MGIGLDSNRMSFPISVSFQISNIKKTKFSTSLASLSSLFMSPYFILIVAQLSHRIPFLVGLSFQFGKIFKHKIQQAWETSEFFPH